MTAPLPAAAPAPIVCPKCGKAVESDWLICPGCEARLKLRCPRCGKPVEKDWCACPACTLTLRAKAHPTRERRPRSMKAGDLVYSAHPAASLATLAGAGIALAALALPWVDLDRIGASAERMRAFEPAYLGAFGWLLAACALLLAGKIIAFSRPDAALYLRWAVDCGAIGGLLLGWMSGACRAGTAYVHAGPTAGPHLAALGLSYLLIRRFSQQSPTVVDGGFVLLSGFGLAATAASALLASIPHSHLAYGVSVSVAGYSIAAGASLLLLFHQLLIAGGPGRKGSLGALLRYAAWFFLLAREESGMQSGPAEAGAREPQAKAE